MTCRVLNLQSTRFVDLSMPSTRHGNVSKPVCLINRTLREQQAEAAKLDAATRLRQAERGRQVAANLKEVGYGG